MNCIELYTRLAETGETEVIQQTINNLEKFHLHRPLNAHEQECLNILKNSQAMKLVVTHPEDLVELEKHLVK